MRSSSRGSTTGSTKRTTTTQQPTSGTVRNNLTTTSGLLNSAGSVNETERTRHSFIITESSKEIQGIVQRSSINARSTQGEKGTERPTTVKPTNSRSKVTSTEVIHRHVGQSSGVLKPTTRGIMGLPLKYFLIISGSFAVVVLGVLCLMCKICKRRYVTTNLYDGRFQICPTLFSMTVVTGHGAYSRNVSTIPSQPYI